MTLQKFFVYWDRYAIPIVFSLILVFSLFVAKDRVWTLDNLAIGSWRLLSFYLLWRLIRQTQIAQSLLQMAVQRLDERDTTRRKQLKIAEDFARAQQSTADDVKRFMDHTTKTMTDDFEEIRQELRQNTAISKKASENSAHAAVASATAADVANHMNEKIAKTNDAVIETLQQLVGVVTPPESKK